jgi:hypothetical protein
MQTKETVALPPFEVSCTSAPPLVWLTVICCEATPPTHSPLAGLSVTLALVSFACYVKGWPPVLLTVMVG